MTRFHSKYHKHNHHTNTSSGFPDSASDPIASQDEPFQGDFYLNGSLSANGGLTFVSGSFVSLSALNLEVDTLQGLGGGTITFTSLSAGSLSAGSFNANSIVTDSLVTSNLTITVLNATSFTTSTLNVNTLATISHGNITTGNFTNVNTVNLTSTNSLLNTIYSNTGNFITLSSNSFVSNNGVISILETDLLTYNGTSFITPNLSTFSVSNSFVTYLRGISSVFDTDGDQILTTQISSIGFDLLSSAPTITYTDIIIENELNRIISQVNLITTALSTHGLVVG